MKKHDTNIKFGYDMTLTREMRKLGIKPKTYAIVA